MPLKLECFPLRKGPYTGAGTIGGWPITSYFGGRLSPITGRPSYHGGMDIAGRIIHLEPLYTVVQGTPFQSWDGGGGGNWSTLYALGSSARFGYGHAHHFEPGVSGKLLPAGKVIAYVDSTGASTGAHLHFAYDSDDPGAAYDDPYDLLVECANAGRFPGVPPTPQTPPPAPPIPPGGLTVTEYQEIMAALNRLEVAVGTDLVFDFAANGKLDSLASRQAEAGWSSRPYLFQLGTKNPDDSVDVDPAVYVLTEVDMGGGKKGWGRMHVTNQVAGGDPVAFLRSLIRLGYNPHVQVITEPADVAELAALAVVNA